MNSVVRLIIPTTHATTVQPIIDRVTRRFGGATFWPAFGTYVRSDDGTIDHEEVTVLEVSLDLTLAEHGWFICLAGDIQRDLNQESVFLSTRSEAGQLVGP